jgi:2-octaprenyl-6-methoxyphenol hydroxylase
MTRQVDVLVAGGGPVGVAFARALARSGIDSVVVERGRGDTQAFRPVALAHGSRLFLDELDAFAGLLTTPITTIHVSQRGSFGRTVMTAAEFALPALGYVADLGDIATHLARRLAPTTVHGRVVSWYGGDEYAAVRIERDGGDAEHWQARLLVLADGGGVRAGLAQRDYGQSAVVAAVSTSRPAPGIAYERFTHDGPIALLPHRAGHALVWTVRREDASALVAADEHAFLRRLEATFGGRLGRFTTALQRAAYPLQLRFQHEPIAAPRVLAIGNASQTLHPVAGQGLNVGLRDAAELAMLVRATPARALGDATFLHRAAAARALDRRAAIGVTDALVRVFGVAHPAAALVRGLGLVALDGLPPARRFFARRMIFGTRALP